jgi:hypothetical protein
MQTAVAPITTPAPPTANLPRWTRWFGMVTPRIVRGEKSSDPGAIALLSSGPRGVHMVKHQSIQ